MLTYPMNHIISAGYLLDEIDVSQVREYISKLTPTTAVTLIRSRTFDWLPDDTPNDATEPDRNTLSGGIICMYVRICCMLRSLNTPL
jgi:hypothetical protein